MQRYINTNSIKENDLVLITGANGFIGQRLVAALLEYGLKNIRCLIRKSANAVVIAALKEKNKDANIEIINGNLLSKEICSEAVKDAKIIYHLAAGTDKSFAGCFMNSVVTSRNIIEAAVTENCLRRFVSISSIAVYDNDHIRPGVALDESCPADSRVLERWEPYVYGKIKQDEIVMQYGRDAGFPWVLIRPGVVFGPGKNQVSGRVGIDTFGFFLHLGLGNKIPFTYVDNCAEAILLAGLVEGIEGETFNVVDDDVPTSAEFLSKYKKHVRNFFSVPVPYPVFYLFCSLWERYAEWSQGQLPPVFNRRRCAAYWKKCSHSNEKAKALLGWKPKIKMKAGLERFFEYQKNE